tara:strand:- start:663 stop:878 length:216 start_codon:yes stop_codon:yes gene_type:complete
VFIHDGEAANHAGQLPDFNSAGGLSTKDLAQIRVNPKQSLMLSIPKGAFAQGARLSGYEVNLDHGFSKRIG